MGCTACVSVRVVADEFVPNATQRKQIRRHADLEVTACRPWATDEQFQLLRRYLAARHPGGGMAEMDEFDFADMVEQSPVNTFIIEYREPSVDGAPGRLVGACLTDQQADGLSMIYSFFDADHPTAAGPRHLHHHGSYRARRDAGLAYVYLGYWVEGSARMAYKTRFRPIERLTARAGSASIRPRPGRCRAERAPLPSQGTGDRMSAGRVRYRGLCDAEKPGSLSSNRDDGGLIRVGAFDEVWGRQREDAARGFGALARWITETRRTSSIAASVPPRPPSPARHHLRGLWRGRGRRRIIPFDIVPRIFSARNGAG